MQQKGSGIGLRPLIAINLLVVMGMLSGLLGIAGLRLMRHGLVSQQVEWGRQAMTQLIDSLLEHCGDLTKVGSCPGLSDWLRKQAVGQSPFLHLSLVDKHNKTVASSDDANLAGELWDAFSGYPAQRVDGAGNGRFRLEERQGERVLVLEREVNDEKLFLRGDISLTTTDELGSRLGRSLWFYAILLLVVFLVLGWVLLVRNTVKPLDKLLLLTDRISEGDIASLLLPERGSEAGRLGVSLSQMALKIEEGKVRMKEQIEKLKLLNRDLHQTQQGLIRSEKLASVGRLSAGLAHELGNPISAVLGYVGMMRSDWEKISQQEKLEYLQRVEQEMERMDKVIKDLLCYSRPKSRLIEPCSPNQLLEDALVLIRPQKKFKEIQFVQELVERLPNVEADADLVRQVLVNLVLNALDAVSPGGTIWIRACQAVRRGQGVIEWGEKEPAFFALGDLHRIQFPHDGKGLCVDRPVVVFTVVDDGSGIATGDLGRLFDPFFSTKEPGKGTGLGLAISHSAVHSMGGDIWAYSRKDKGTQLAFYLPVAGTLQEENCGTEGRETNG